MRVSTKYFKDYYDPVAFQFHDSNDPHIWNRGKDTETFNYPRLQYRIGNIDGMMWIVGFCGKFHLGWHPLKSNQPITYDIDVIKKYLFDCNYKFSHRWLEDWFNEISKPDPEIFIQYQTPTLYIKPDIGWVETDPILRSLDFYKVFDTYSAWVELENFYYNYLTTSDEAAMIRVSDVDMAKAKGFTHKYSFKKEPER